MASLGGLTHSINAALAFCGPDDRLLPLSWIGKDIYPDIQKLWPDDNRLSRNGFLPYNSANNCVELNYIDANERIEKSLNPMPSLHFKEVLPFLDVDIILVNLISGWDVDLKFMKELRKTFHGLIGIDIHSLTLERLSDGTRRLRLVENIKSWLDCADLIQLNEREFGTIAPRGMKPEDFFLRTCVQTDKIINLTKGSQGSVSYRVSNDCCEVLNMSATPGIKIVDPIGCGDAFFAAFGINYGKTGDIKFAARKASIAASLAGSTKGLIDNVLLQRQLKEYTREDG